MEKWTDSVRAVRAERTSLGTKALPALNSQPSTLNCAASCRASLLRLSGEQPEQIGQAIDPVRDLWAHGAARGRQGVQAAFGAACDHAGLIEGQ
jgi:hypothetical protein